MFKRLLLQGTFLIQTNPPLPECEQTHEYNEIFVSLDHVHVYAMESHGGGDSRGLRKLRPLSQDCEEHGRRPKVLDEITGYPHLGLGLWRPCGENMFSAQTSDLPRWQLKKQRSLPVSTATVCAFNQAQIKGNTVKK